LDEDPVTERPAIGIRLDVYISSPIHNVHLLNYLTNILVDNNEMCEFIDVEEHENDSLPVVFPHTNMLGYPFPGQRVVPTSTPVIYR
jgi:hypothetical protein